MPEDLPRIDVSLFAAMVFEGALILVSFGLGGLLGVDPLAQLSWSWQAASLGLAAVVPLVLAMLAMVHFPSGPWRSVLEIMERAIVPWLRQGSPWQWLVLALLAGVGEEMVFRGALQAWLEQALGSPWWAIGLSSVAFGLAHPLTRAYLVLASMIGLLFGGLFWWSGNLLTPIVAHGVYDFVAVVYLVRHKYHGCEVSVG